MRKGVEIVEAEGYQVHIHMLVKIIAKYCVSEIVGYLDTVGKIEERAFRLTR